MLTSEQLAIRQRDEWPFTIEVVPLADLFADDTYQRPALDKFIRQMAGNFNEQLVGAIDVSRRTNETLAILDGFQRVEGMRQVGKTVCYAATYEGMSIPDEAAFFYRKNKLRRNMHSFYGFRARLVAVDPAALAVNEAIEMEGFYLAPTTNHKEAIGAVSAAESVFGYESHFREQSLSAALRVVRESFFGRKNSLDAEVIRGIGRFMQSFPDEELDTGILYAALGELGPVGLIGRAHDLVQTMGGRHGHSAGYEIGRTIVNIYNDTAPRGEKLDPRVLIP